MPHGPFGLHPASSTATLWLSALLLAQAGSSFGCGGRALPEGESEDEQGIAGRSGGGAGGSIGARGGSGSTPNPRPGDPIGTEPEVLPRCEPGFRESRANGRACTFIYDGLCYEEREMACACACPRGGTCIIGGFLDPEEPFPVRCSVQ